MMTTAGGLGGDVSIIQLVERVFEGAVPILDDVLEHRQVLALHPDRVRLVPEPDRGPLATTFVDNSLDRLDRSPGIFRDAGGEFYPAVRIDHVIANTRSSDDAELLEDDVGFELGRFAE